MPAALKMEAITDLGLVWEVVSYWCWWRGGGVGWSDLLLPRSCLPDNVGCAAIHDDLLIGEFDLGVDREVAKNGSG